MRICAAVNFAAILTLLVAISVARRIDEVLED